MDKKNKFPYNSTDMPLSVRISADRFTNILLSNEDILSKKGMIVDNVNVSFYNMINTNGIYDVIKYMKKEDSKSRIYHVVSSFYNNGKLIPNIDYSIKNQDLHLYVYTCEDHDTVIPGILVADSTGVAYFLYHSNSSQYSQKVDASPAGFHIKPVSNTLYEDLRKDFVKDILAQAYATIDSYTYRLYEVGLNYTLSEYFIEVAKKMSFKYEHSVIDDMIYVPLVDLGVDANNNLTITGGIYQSGSKLKKIQHNENKNNNLIVLYSEIANGSRKLRTNVIKQIFSANGQLHMINESTDLSGNGESMQLVTENEIVTEQQLDGTVIAGSRYTDKSIGVSEKYVYRYEKLIDDKKSSVTENNKKEIDKELLSIFNENMISKAEAFSLIGLPEAVKYLNKTIKNVTTMSKKEVYDTIHGALMDKAKGLAESKDFEKLIYLYDFREILNNKIKVAGA